MEIIFASSRIAKELNSEKGLKQYPEKIRKTIRNRLVQIQAAENLNDLFIHPFVPRMNLHKLEGGNDLYAINVSDQHRMILRPVIQDHDSESLENPCTIHCVEIVEAAIDYH